MPSGIDYNINSLCSGVLLKTHATLGNDVVGGAERSEEVLRGTPEIKVKMKFYRIISLLVLMGLGIPAAGQDIDAIIGAMTRREKIAQIIIAEADTQDSPQRRQAQKQWVAEGLGGLIVMDDPLGPCMAMVNDLQARAKIPMIVTIDGEWGASMRFYEFAAFPKAMQMGALPYEDLVYNAGYAIGDELKELKIFVNFAPDTDINNNPKNPVIGIRSFGEDREKVATYGSAFMRGMQQAGVAGAAKHFPGHGDTEVDSHKGLPVLSLGRDRLDSLELYPFKRLIEDGVEMVMIGHLSVPALDPSGTPASISKPIITGLLRQELGFNGIIITDALGMKGLSNDYGDAAVAAYQAGVDILLMPRDAGQAIDELDAMFESGQLDEAGLDGRVRKMLNLKKKYGLLAPGYSPYVDPSEAIRSTLRPYTENLIQTICDQSMTVIQGKELLPIEKGRTAYISVRAGTKQSQAFFLETCFCNYPVDRFILHGAFTADDLEALKGELKAYENIIIVFHSGAPIKRTGGPRLEAFCKPEQFKALASLAADHTLFGVWAGNPYKLAEFPEYKDFQCFIVSYSDTAFNNKAAVHALFKGTARGVLPVTIK